MGGGARLLGGAKALPSQKGMKRNQGKKGVAQRKRERTQQKNEPENADEAGANRRRRSRNVVQSCCSPLCAMLDSKGGANID